MPGNCPLCQIARGDRRRNARWLWIDAGGAVVLDPECEGKLLYVPTCHVKHPTPRLRVQARTALRGVARALCACQGLVVSGWDFAESASTFGEGDGGDHWTASARLGEEKVR